MKDYHINIFFSEEDGGYIADIPDLKFCSAFGSTPEEALAEVEKAKEAWMEVARSTNRPIPLPRYRPAIYQSGPSQVRDRGGQGLLGGSFGENAKEYLAAERRAWGREEGGDATPA